MKRHKLAPVSAGSKKDEWVGFHFDFDLKTILPAPNRISLFDLKGDMQKGKKRTVRSLRTRVSSRPAKRVLSVELLWNPTKKKPTESNYTLRFWFFWGGFQFTGSRSESFGSDSMGMRSRPAAAPSDLDLARPQTAGEEELQLQLALAMSREEAEKEDERRRSDDVRLALAMAQSNAEDAARYKNSLNSTAIYTRCRAPKWEPS